MKDMIKNCEKIFKNIENLSIDKKVETINEIKLLLSKYSPFKDEPVDCVLWVKNELVKGNDYNPNKVAPPEMKLLETSILEDGYTQPIVTWKNDDSEVFEVVDGFHRNRVGKESEVIKNKIFSYLPVVKIRNTQSDKNNRISSTIRHNRARGKHQIDAMSQIVLELKRRNWTNERICKNLGLDDDEILRLCQITGLSELFSDQEFSKSWDIEDSYVDFEPLTDIVTDEEKEKNKFRTVNTSDENRIFHTYDKWECYKAGFYNTTKDDMTKEQCEQEYCNFLKDEKLFSDTLEKVINEWKHSCEHYLTNESMNRIAWLGQASLCYAKGIPSAFRGGFHLLTKEEQDKANLVALKYLNKWLKNNGRKEVDLESAITDREATIY